MTPVSSCVPNFYYHIIIIIIIIIIETPVKTNLELWLDRVLREQENVVKMLICTLQPSAMSVIGQYCD